jgi:hypothetical protein
MSKTSTLTALVALTLGTTCLQTNFASARASLSMTTTSQMASVVNAPAQQPTTVTQTSSPTVSNNGSSTHTSSAMDSSRNSGGDVHGRSKYMVITHVKHTDPTVGDRIKNSFSAKDALPNSAATGGRIPQVQTGTINGNGKGKGGKSVPGFDNVGNGPRVNLPGSINNNGVKSVPGFENADNGLSVNLPGSRKKGSAADADNFLAGQEDANVAALRDAAAQGPSVNLPSQSSDAQEQADGLLDSIVKFFTGGSSEANAKSGETRAPANATNANGEAKGQSGASADQHTVVTSENLKGQYTDSSGRAIMTEGYMMRDAFTGEITGGSMSIVGPITITKSKNMPSDDSTGPVDARAELAINNPFMARNKGGGTDNNVDQAGAGTGDVAPNSSYAQKENGDGSNDAGENHTTSSGALASSSSLARKDQGDGGNADNRGGGNSSTPGKI